MGIRRTRFCFFAALALVAGACKGDATRSTSATTTTSSTSTTTSTTLPPTTTTTTVPPVPIGRNTRIVATRNGVIAPVAGVNADGSVVITTPCGNRASVAGATAVGPVDIVLDPGHGGDESGAVGANGLAERTLNLAVANRTVAALQRSGIRVLLTRTADYRITLDQRAAIIKAAAPKAAVSVHHNGGSDGPRESPGTEVFYQHASADSRRLAGLIYEEVFKALSQYTGIAWQADRDAGAKTRLNGSGGDYYGMLRRPAPVVTVLSEALFLSNPPEAELLARADVQQVEADAIARAIVRYLTTADPGSGFTESYPRTEPAGPGGGGTGCVDPPLQ